MKVQRQAIVIVGADRQGYYIGPAMQGRGYQCIHVAVDHKPSDTTDCPTWFTREIRIASNDDEVIHDLFMQLKRYDIKAVVAAGENGVIAANKLAQYFDIPRNPAGSARLHRHKYHMIEALRQNGIPCSAQFVSSHLEEILAWYRISGFPRVVMKPALGGYSDGVGICENEAEITDVFERNIGKINVVGEIKDEYVIQEFLEGKHFVVNTVSVEGKHFVTDIWHDVNHYEDTFLIDEYSDSVCRDSPDFATLSNYVYAALDALRIRNGPAHSEVMLTPQGPRLIETGARLAGGIDFSVVEECNGYSQISVLADSLIAPHLFSQRAALCESAPSAFARFIYMSSHVGGRTGTHLDLDRLLEIPGLMSVKLTVEAGGELVKTKYALGHPGYAMLLANSRDALTHNYAKFRELERSFFLDAIRQDRRTNDALIPRTGKSRTNPHTVYQTTSGAQLS